MHITNPLYLRELRQLKQSYHELPWYQRFWFSLCSFSLSNALTSIDLSEPTSEQIARLYEQSKNAWFFNSIFGLLNLFKNSTEDLDFLAQEQFSYSGQFDDIKKRLWQYLTPKEQATMALVSKENYHFFQTLPIHPFLLAVTRNETDKVISMLENNNDLFFQRASVTTDSGRKFFNITGFEYSCWALNEVLCIKMIACLPQNYRHEIINLLEHDHIKEATYELNGNKFSEKHFNPSPFLIELAVRCEYIQKYNYGDFIGKKYEDCDFIGKEYEDCMEGIASIWKLVPINQDNMISLFGRFEQQPLNIFEKLLLKVGMIRINKSECEKCLIILNILLSKKSDFSIRIRDEFAKIQSFEEYNEPSRLLVI